MAYYSFNIGQPATTAWWQQNLARQVITAGYDAETGDRGDQILNQLHEGDWVLAYCNRSGFVGAGQVLGSESYRLHPNIPDESLSDHRHERKVEWGPFVVAVTQGIQASSVGTHSPRQTKEQLDSETGKRLIKLLTKRASLHGNQPLPALGNWKYWHIPEAVRALGRAATIRNITDWLARRYPDEGHSDARDNARLLCVNDVSRRHHDRSRVNFRSDQNHPKDVLFRSGGNSNVSYQLYDPFVHGIWDIHPNTEGKWEVTQVEAATSAIDQALQEAREQIASEHAPSISNDHDARVWALRAVALREGQSEFRTALLNAYDRKCAITDCRVVEILEAAHIRPYRGEHTHRVDNGLLLRADVHTLFDKGMIWVDMDGTVKIDRRLAGSEYESLQGHRLRLPSNPAEHPHPDHLAHHRQYAITGNSHIVDR